MEEAGARAAWVRWKFEGWDVVLGLSKRGLEKSMVEAGGEEFRLSNLEVEWAQMYH